MIRDRSFIGHTNSINCVSVSEDSRIVITGSDDRTIRVFDCRERKAVQCIAGYFNDSVNNITFGRSSMDIISSCGPIISTFDLRRTERVIINEASFSITTNSNEEVSAIDVKISPGKGLRCNVAIGDDSGTISLLDLTNGKLVKSYRNIHTNICSSLAYHPHSFNFMVSGGFDCRLLFWDVTKRQPQDVLDFSTKVFNEGTNPQLTNPPFIHCVKYVLDGKGVACALGDGSIRVVDSISHIEICKANEAHSSMVTSLITYGQHMISGSTDRWIRSWTIDLQSMDAMGLSDVRSDNHNHNHGGASRTRLKSRQVAYDEELTSQWIIPHDNKINALCGTHSSQNIDGIYVADTSCNLSRYVSG